MKSTGFAEELKRQSLLKAAVAFLFLAAVVLFTGCDDRTVVDPVKRAEDSLRAAVTKQTDSLSNLFSQRPAAYKLLKYRGKSLSAAYGNFGEELILALNRIDKSFLRNKDTIVVPDTIVKNILYYSPFSLKLNGAASMPKLIIVSQNIQAFAAYVYGNLVKWGPVSTGKSETPTKNGLLHTNWKAKETISTFNDEWDLKWYFNLDNFEGVSLHQYELPGYPASHACARMREQDAEWLYYWAEQWIVTKDENNIIAQGTPVIIFGEYDYDNPKVWRRLADDMDAAVVTKNELESIVTQYSATILKRKQVRDLVLSSRQKQKEKIAKK